MPSCSSFDAFQAGPATMVSAPVSELTVTSAVVRNARSLSPGPPTPNGAAPRGACASGGGLPILRGAGDAVPVAAGSARPARVFRRHRPFVVLWPVCSLGLKGTPAASCSALA